MFLTLGLYAWMWRRLGERKPEFVMMISIILLTLIVSAVFTGEPRYTYSILFVFYLLFFKLIELYREDRRGWVRPALIYAVLLATATAATAGVNEVIRRDLGPRGVRLTVLPDSASPPVEVEVRRMLFPHGKKKIGLFHVTEDYPPLRQAAPVRMQTRMEVLGTGPLLVEFEMYSAWRFGFYVDKRQLLFSENMDYFTASTVLIQLEPGVHEIEIVLEYQPLIGGFAASYNYWEPNGWRVRRFLGVSWERIRFLMPETTAALPPQ
jgi:energy-coupling factor transporter transmembrane protein EcfT